MCFFNCKAVEKKSQYETNKDIEYSDNCTLIYKKLSTFITNTAKSCFKHKNTDGTIAPSEKKCI